MPAIWYVVSLESDHFFPSPPLYHSLGTSYQYLSSGWSQKSPINWSPSFSSWTFQATEQQKWFFNKTKVTMKFLNLIKVKKKKNPKVRLCHSSVKAPDPLHFTHNKNSGLTLTDWTLKVSSLLPLWLHLSCPCHSFLSEHRGLQSFP